TPVLPAWKPAPSDASVPRRLALFDRIAGVLVLLTLLTWSLWSRPLSPAKLQAFWLAEWGAGLKSGASRMRLGPWAPTELERSYLVLGRKSLGTEQADRVICQAAGMKDCAPERVTQFKEPTGWLAQVVEERKRRPNSDWLLVSLASDWFATSAAMKYWPKG